MWKRLISAASVVVTVEGVLLASFVDEEEFGTFRAEGQHHCATQGRNEVHDQEVLHRPYATCNVERKVFVSST